MFSTFPDGWSGTGLLLLRAAAGVVFIVRGTTYFSDEHGRGMLMLVVGLLTIVVGGLVLVGYLTRFAAAAVALASVSSAFSWFPGSNLSETRMTAVLVMVIAAATVCLGPGAFSLDARLFGRREIIILSGSSNQ